jgi:hypothetical protein
MFTERTVFVFGAGASWHYGYPTGEELVKKVREKARFASQFFENSMTANNSIPVAFLSDQPEKQTFSLQEQWRAAWTECNDLEAGLEQVKPLVIDYFLGWNPRLRPIGKLLIAWVILECEHKRTASGGNVNRKEVLLNSPLEADRSTSNAIDIKQCKDDWCRFLVHELAINCQVSADLLKNQVSFVTFNYDTSIESFLYHGLRHIQLFQADDIRKFIDSDSRVRHIYGKVRKVGYGKPTDLKWSEQSRDPKSISEFELHNYHASYGSFLDTIYAASCGLRVIDPEDKEADKEIIEGAAMAIEGAKQVYILGYGFDPNNSQRLGLAQSLRYDIGSDKRVFFTNFGDINRVNKRASKIFFGNARHFPVAGTFVEESVGSYYYEKSRRDVYEALELDFEALG